MTELESLLILNAIASLGNSRIRKLIEHFGSAQEVLKMTSEGLLKENLITPKMADAMRKFDQDDFLKKEFPLIETHHVRIVKHDDEHYPALLKMIPDAPLLLYWKGALEKIEPLSIAMVGSRQASSYGLRMAKQFAVELSGFGVNVVSGMARGIDTAAHQGALKSNGATIAVLGSGLANIYPRENIKLFKEIVEAGAVVSEFPMRTAPMAYNFPRRNRIVSGLSLGVIVIEAFERSGALITSRMALEQGREVFALPGNVNSPTAKGVNNLIKQGAKLMTCLEDVLEELKPQMEDLLHSSGKKEKTIKIKKETKPSVSITPINLSKEENKIYDILNFDPIHIDTLADRCEMNVMQLSSVVLGLELKKLIKPLPGKLYVKSR